MSYWIVHFLNGISFAMVLFLIAAGLSLILGLMQIVNLAHGAFYTLGAYIALSTYFYTGNFILSVVSGAIAVGILGISLQRIFLRRFQQNILGQLLLTLGFMYMFSDLSLWVWSQSPQLLPKPCLFQASIRMGSLSFPSYRLLIIFLGILMGISLWFFMERSKMGALIRAGVDDIEMARALGIKIPLLFTVVFGLGAVLGGFGGAIAAPFIGVYAGLEWEVMLLALAVLLIGGLESWKGSFIGSLFVGLADNFGKVLIPELSLFVIFGSVAIVLAFKPTGLLGKSH